MLLLPPKCLALCPPSLLPPRASAHGTVCFLAGRPLCTCRCLTGSPAPSHGLLEHRIVLNVSLFSAMGSWSSRAGRHHQSFTPLVLLLLWCRWNGLEQTSQAPPFLRTAQGGEGPHPSRPGFLSTGTEKDCQTQGLGGGAGWKGGAGEGERKVAMPRLLTQGPRLMMEKLLGQVDGETSLCCSGTGGGGST